MAEQHGKLPVWRTWRAALAFLRADGARVARWCVLPLSLGILSRVAVPAPEAPPGWTLVLLVAEIAVWLPIAVAVHRSIGLPSNRSIDGVALDRRSARYAMAFAKVSFLACLALVSMFVIATVAMLPSCESMKAGSAAHEPDGDHFHLLGLALFAAAGLVVPRLWLGLPAVALDRGVSLAESWRLGSGNTFRLGAAVGLPWLFLPYGIYTAMREGLPMLERLLGFSVELPADVLTACIETGATLAGIVALSLSFLHLSGAGAREPALAVAHRI